MSVASQRNVPPYCAVTAGPKSHSPAPIAEPATTTPGPINLASCRHPNLGGGISSPTCHGATVDGSELTASEVVSVDILTPRFLDRSGRHSRQGLVQGGHQLLAEQLHAAKPARSV